MKRPLKLLAIIGIVLGATIIILPPIFATTISETEPNDTPAQANALSQTDVISASIGTVGDVDYFSIPGVNTSWGFIALLDTSAATGSQQATLTALGSDGSTLLQTDTGSWEYGSGIALQNYADGNVDHYLKVNEQSDGATISNYTLRHYSTIVATKPEVEPNETRTTGTLSAFTHAGTLSGLSDVDCFSFAGSTGDSMVFALNGDPEGDGSPVDPQLSLIAPDDTVLKSVNFGGTGDNEFITYDSLPSDGIYAYCVSAAGGTGGSTATYTVGLVRNNWLYIPSFTIKSIQIDPPNGDWVQPGETLTFQVSITNTSAITIPGDVNTSLRYDAACLQPISTNPLTTSSSSGLLDWYGQKNTLTPGEVYSTTATFEALKPCSSTVSQYTQLSYYLTGTARDAGYVIAHSIYLPLILR